MPDLHPCDVCGEPTSGKLGVCPRTTECRSEYRRLSRYAKAGQAAPPRPTPRPCALCGRLTTSLGGVCSRGSCKAEYQRQKIAATGHVVTPYTYGQCEVCGRRCRADLGVCQETPQCRTEYNRRFRASHREELRAYKNQDRASNLERERGRDRKRYVDNRAARLALARRIREAHPDVIAGQNRRYYAANHDAILARQRKYMARLDRPCRYSASGCTEFACPGGNCCQEHHAARARRKRATRRQNMARAQGWACPWCTMPLPADLGGTDVDHIIPVASGGPDEAWNFQLLHGPCNRAKWDRVTPQAIALAAAHGIVLALPSAA